MNNFILLFLEFTKVGFFTIGGGYATLPFLYHFASQYHWFSANYITQMLAISSIMPGPIGINLSAQTGFIVGKFWGAFASVLGIMLPAFLFVFIIAKLLKQFKNSKIVEAVFYILKPTSCGMVLAIGVKLLKNCIFIPNTSVLFSLDWIGLFLFLSLFYLSLKKHFHPIFYLSVSAFVGVLIKFVTSFF